MNTSCQPKRWPNPWADVIVYVTLEELAECFGGLGQSCGRSDGSSFIWTKELVLAHWRTAGKRLDPYILPQPNGWHSIGIRYGSKGSQYLSPMGDDKKVTALLKKYRAVT